MTVQSANRGLKKSAKKRTGVHAQKVFQIIRLQLTVLKKFVSLMITVLQAF